MAEPADDIAELGADVLLKLRRQIIHGTGEHEILPHQQSQLITDVEEEIIRIITAAPDTDGVEVGHGSVLQKNPCALGGDAAEQVILGYIVGAHGKNGDAVDGKGEGFALFIFLPRDVKGAKTDPLFPDINGQTGLIEELGFQRIQRMLAVSVWPPQTRLFHEHMAVGGGAHDISVGIGQRIADRQPAHRSPGGNIHLGIQAQGDPAVPVHLTHLHTLELGLGNGPEIDGPVYAGIGEAGTPVPAIHAVCLADHGKALDGIGGAGDLVPLVGRMRSAQGRAQKNGQSVFPFMDKRTDIDHVGPVHVFGVQDKLIVDRDIGERVDALHHETEFKGTEQGCIRDESLAVDVVCLHQVISNRFLIPIVGVGHFSIVHQIHIHRSWNYGRKPFGIRDRTHFPVGGKVKNVSHNWPPMLLFFSG